MCRSPRPYHYGCVASIINSVVINCAVPASFYIHLKTILLTSIQVHIYKVNNSAISFSINRISP